MHTAFTLHPLSSTKKNLHTIPQVTLVSFPAKQLQQRHVPVGATRGFWASRRIGQAAQHRGKALVTLQHRAEGLRMAFPYPIPSM